ncbi:MAG: 2-oxo acid dehydrogenase subunit E2 [Alphaproteobacteria bacterium]|nr:2-oxo acid dehydrogenase subunit E2 [Alphaproteobacteria bacterium]
MGRYVFKLPDIGEGTAEAELVAWHVAIGDSVEEDQPLFDVMTDKATVEVTSPVTGTIIELNGEPGQMASIGSSIVVLEVEGAGNERANGKAAHAEAAPKADAKPAPPPKAEPKPAPKPEPKAEPRGAASSARPPAFATRATPDAKPLASPAVRQRARDMGVELQFVAGSGPAGRIEHADLDAHVSQGRSARGSSSGVRYAQRDGVEEIKVIGLRRKIAEKMQEAKRRIPHFAYVEEVDVTELEALRQQLNMQKRADQPKLTLLPFIMRALCEVLPDYPQINATFDDEAGVVHRHAAVHIGIATQTANGLIVPVVKHAEARDLWDSAAEVARVAQATREGKAARDELSGATITITSLGPLGGVVTTPVINHPEVAIIGPNKIVERPVVRDGHIAVRKIMNLSSSFDHRVVDGYDAAEFIQRVKAMLEHPAILFMGGA